jgi:hypothetical protein
VSVYVYMCMSVHVCARDTRLRVRERVPQNAHPCIPPAGMSAGRERAAAAPGGRCVCAAARGPVSAGSPPALASPASALPSPGRARLRPRSGFDTPDLDRPGRPHRDCVPRLGSVGSTRPHSGCVRPLDGLSYIVSQLFPLTRARSRGPGARGARRDSMGER